MIYPIPKSSAEAFEAFNEHGVPQNAGLILDRFSPDWVNQPDLKKTGLKNVKHASENADKKLLEAWNNRWEQTAAVTQAKTFELKTDWRLIAGLGQKGSLEVGFTFQRYGFPILPGSSLKGLARSSALLSIARMIIGFTELKGLQSLQQMVSHTEKRELGPLSALETALNREKEEDFLAEIMTCAPGVTLDEFLTDPTGKVLIELAQKFRAIFGTLESAGRIIFFDAIPIKNKLPVLELDIINPHYSKYYQGSEKELPTNWQKPMPVYFLAVGAKNTFRFAIGWRSSPCNSKPDTNLQNQAVDWLKFGLFNLGLGAKTSAGYGYFFDSDKMEKSQVGTAKVSQTLPQGYERGIVMEFGLGEHQSYGFIKRSNGSKIFVHRNNLSSGLDTLYPGMRVIFKIGKGETGPKALDVSSEA
jgi:CRISPR-associated protein Cmr6